MKILIIIIILLLIFGCANERQKPDQVNVPVTVACVKDRPTRPVYYFEQLPKPNNEAEVADQVRILWKDKEAAIAYGDKLEVATAGCQALP